MRKGNSGKKRRAEKKMEKRLMRIVATTSLPAVDRAYADSWNAARLCQKKNERERIKIRT